MRKKRPLPAGLKPGARGNKGKPPADAPKISFTRDVDGAQEWRKPHLIGLTFCDFISLDSVGKVNLLGCFDRIYVDRETNQTGSFFLFVRTAGTRKGQVDVTFLNPNNRPVAQLTYEVVAEEISEDKPAHVQFYGRFEFVAKEHGVYWIDVGYNGESLGGRDLTITLRETGEVKDERGS